MTNCREDRLVLIRPGPDPVVVTVDAGYATNGKFKADLRLPDGWHTGVGAGNVADTIPDRFTLPADPAELAKSVSHLLILGSYAPAHPPTGRQIRVWYTLTQGGEEVHREVIERDNVDALRCDHVYRFELEQDHA